MEEEEEKTLGPARIQTPDHPHCSIVTIPTTLSKLPSGVTTNIYHSCYITFGLLEDGDLSFTRSGNVTSLDVSQKTICQ
jgi:hypothetical protein